MLWCLPLCGANYAVNMLCTLFVRLFSERSYCRSRKYIPHSSPFPPACGSLREVGGGAERWAAAAAEEEESCGVQGGRRGWGAHNVKSFCGSILADCFVHTPHNNQLRHCQRNTHSSRRTPCLSSSSVFFALQPPSPQSLSHVLRVAGRRQNSANGKTTESNRRLSKLFTHMLTGGRFSWFPDRCPSHLMLRYVDAEGRRLDFAPFNLLACDARDQKLVCKRSKITWH